MDCSKIKNLCMSHKNVDALFLCDYNLEKNPTNQEVLIIKASLLRLCQDFDASLDLLGSNSFSTEMKDQQLELLYDYIGIEDYPLALEQLASVARNYRLTDRETKRIKEIHMSLLGVEYPEKLKSIYRDKGTNYNQKQLLNYSEDEAIKFIVGNKKHTVFNCSFDIVPEFERLKREVYHNEYYPNIIYDTYYIPYTNCGYNRGIICNYLQVDTIKDTNHIVRMFPIPEEETMRYAREDYQKRYLKK